MGRTQITAKVESVPKRWMSKDEAMKYLGCSDKFLKTLRDKSEISYARYGNKTYWYDVASIDRFIARNKVV